MNLDTGVIYVITNNVNGKQYVGQAVSYSPNGREWGSHRRWSAHLKNARNGKCECRLLESAICKYGEDAFKVEDILACSIQELNEYEKRYIQEYNTLVPNGYNLMTGGGNGRRHAKETRERMSSTRIGKQHSNITRERIANANRGLVVDLEGRKNIGVASKYRNMSDDNKIRLQEALDKLSLEVLPMYIYLKVDTIVVKVPNTKNKQFGKKNMALTEKISLAIEYKNSHRNGHRSEGSSQPQ